MARKRATYHHRDLPEALLEAADALVAEKGAHGFSLREAARIVGVDPAACYRHFRDREAVLKALARRGFTRLAARMKAALARVDRSRPDRAIATLGRAYVAFAIESPSAFRAMFGPSGVDARDPSLRGTYPDGRGPYDLLLDSLRAWSAQERLDLDVDAAAVTLWSGVHGIASLLVDGALRPASDRERTRAVEALIDTMMAGLRGP